MTVSSLAATGNKYELERLPFLGSEPRALARAVSEGSMLLEAQRTQDSDTENALAPFLINVDTIRIRCDMRS